MSSDRSDYEALVDALGWTYGYLAAANDTRETLLDIGVATRRSEGLSAQSRLLITDAIALAIEQASHDA